MEHNERIHELETQVSLLEKDSQIHTKVIDKLDATVENIHDLAQAMHRMVSIHEERFKVQDRENLQLEELIDERREEAMKDTQQVKKSIEDSEKRILEKFEELKKDLTEKIDKLSQLPKKDELDTKLKFVKTIFENWKYIAFGIAFGVGVLTHKWGIFQNLFGSSSP